MLLEIASEEIASKEAASLSVVVNRLKGYASRYEFPGEPLRRYGFQENIQDGTVSRRSLRTVRVPRRTSSQIRQCHKTSYKTVLQTGLGRGAPACGLRVVFQAESHQRAGGVLRSRQNPPCTGAVAHSAKCAVDW